MAASVTCERCGASVPAGARFCPSCGAPQSDARREERRVVTVLFGDLAGFTELSERRDAEEVKQIVDTVFVRLAEIVTDHGGRVDKVIGDEIMAVFGAPQAHEDDPERAVRAALAMQRELGERSDRLREERGVELMMHIGVNTGEAIAGLVGGSDSYSVMGDAVNTARRIEDAAEAGSILVGQATYEATREAITYRRMGQVSAKGKRAPVAVWQAVSEKGLPGERGSRSAPLIGREEELVLLESLAAIVRRDARPTIVTLLGDAGLGKSRLASDFATRAGLLGWPVLDARSLPYGSSAPAFEVEELLRQGLELPTAGDGDPLGALKEALDRIGAAAETDVLAAFLGMGGEVRGRTEASAPGATPTATTDASVALESARIVLERLAAETGGLVLVLHDLHWGEEAVLDFVQGLLGGSAPLLVLCLARPELLERRPGWGAPVGSVLLRVQPLSRERAGEMLDLLAPSLPLAMRESVLDRAGGNPFYLEELARMILDRPEESIDTLTVPVGVQALVATRIDALPEVLKRVVQDAAVVGERFWPGALRAMGDDPGDALHAPELAELIERAPDQDLAGDPGYRIVQSLVREVAYNSVPKHLRAGHHAAVGAWLEQAAEAVDRGRELVDLIAYHYERAATLGREIGSEDADAINKARVYLERAGDLALGQDAARTATRFFERALTVARDEADSLGLRLRLGEALVGSNRHAEGAEHLRAALGEARSMGDRRAEGRSLRLLGDSYRMQGQGDRARQPLEQALAIAKEIGDEGEEAAGLRARGQLDLFQGRWQSSILWFRQALARFRALGDRRGEAWSLQNLGWASMFIGRLDDASAYLREGEAIFVELDDEEGAGWCIGMRGWVHLLQGEVEEAGRIAEALERYLSTERPEYLLTAGFVLELQRILRSYVEVQRCHFAQATSIAHQALASGDASGVAWVHALGHYPPFLAALLQRRFSAARRELDAGIDGATRLGDPFYQGQARFAEAFYAFETGDLDGAERILDGLTTDDERGGIWRASAAATWLRAGVFRGRGEMERALEQLRAGGRTKGIALLSPAMLRVLAGDILCDLERFTEAVTEAEAGVDQAGEETLTRLMGLRVLGRAHAGAGRARDAERVLRDALQLLDETDWTIERVRVMSVLARVVDDDGRFDEAAQITDEAAELLDGLPPDSDVEPVRAMLHA